MDLITEIREICSLPVIPALKLYRIMTIIGMNKSDIISGLGISERHYYRLKKNTDTQVSDTQVSDTQVSDTQVSDTQVSDTEFRALSEAWDLLIDSGDIKIGNLLNKYKGDN